MEFDYENNRVIGIVQKKHFNNENAKIEVIGIVDEDDNYSKVSKNSANETFKPNGFIFAFDFFKNYTYKENEIIEVSVKPNNHQKEGHDEYILNRVYPRFGIPIYPLNGFSVSNQSVNLLNIQIIGDYEDGYFYGKSDKYIIGKLKISNGVLSPVESNKINRWEIEANEINILKSGNCYILIDDPISESSIIDCMSSDELFEWFRIKLKQIDYESVRKLNSIGKWQKEIPKIFDTISKSDAELEKLRLIRIEKYISQFELEVNEVNNFILKSPSLKIAFEKSLENHKEYFKSKYAKELNEIENEINLKKNKLRIEFDKSEHEAKTIIEALNAEVNQKQIEIQKAKEEHEQEKKRLFDIENEKSRIISDFAIIKEVLNLSSKTTDSNTEKNYILEELNTTSDHIQNIDDFINNIKYYLYYYDLNPDFTKRILETLHVYKAVFVKDIRIALSVIKASGNAKYIIQNTEPDWLHFKDFWNNGLSAIWNSAHQNPETPHYFVLEDINISSPECYARPLLDVITGIRSKIPFAETCYPDNLIIFATKASSHNPTIGLKLYKETFPDWGSVAFNNDAIYRKNQRNFSKIEGKIYSTVFSFDNLESDIDEIRISVSTEYEHLFDEE